MKSIKAVSRPLVSLARDAGNAGIKLPTKILNWLKLACPPKLQRRWENVVVTAQLKVNPGSSTRIQA